MLLGKTDAAVGLIDQLAGCFVDRRRPELIEHRVRALLGKPQARRACCAPLTGKSTLNRLELFPR